MSRDIIIPKLGAEMTSAVITQWEKNNGDFVKAGEVVLTIETDKLQYEIEAPEAGTLQIEGEEGTEYPIGIKVASLLTVNDNYESNNNVTLTPSPNAELTSKQPFKASPLAKKIALQHGIDLHLVKKGSGPGGVIRSRDLLPLIKQNEIDLQTVECEISASEVLPENNQNEAEEEATLQKEVYKKSTVKILPFAGMRKNIAERMHKSLQLTAQMTDLNEIEVCKLVTYRNELNSQQDQTGFTFSFTDLIIKAISILLKKYPIFNASIENDEIKIWKEINIGIAVALKDGLIVPVIHHADQLSLSSIHLKLEELVQKARTKTLRKDDISGGTFTITNFGSVGGFLGTPILHSPEVAILGTGEIKKKPVVREEEIIIGHVMGYSMTVDHRIIDGATAVAFQKEFRYLMEHPYLLTVM